MIDNFQPDIPVLGLPVLDLPDNVLAFCFE